MEVRNCKGCGRLFNYMGGNPLCPSCAKALDEKFEVVKEYIYDHPGAGIQEVAEENEVSTSILKRWVREEKLAFSDDSPIGVECEGCGCTIKTGRFCKTCKDKMANCLGNAYAVPTAVKPAPKAADAKAKMRYLDN